MEWKRIGNFDYEISQEGTVRNLKTNKILTNSIDGAGYYTVGLQIALGVRRTHKIHRLLMEAFVPNPEGKKTVNHINGIKTDNRFENLEWATYQENSKHSVLTGLQISVKGSRHGRSKLKEGDIKAIRTIHKNDNLFKVASLFNVSIGAVSLIRNRKTWTHI